MCPSAPHKDVFREQRTTCPVGRSCVPCCERPQSAAAAGLYALRRGNLRRPARHICPEPHLIVRDVRRCPLH